MDPFSPTPPPPSLLSDALAAARWDSLVRSMESALDGVADLKIIAIALAAVLVLLLNIRLARWIARRAGRARRP